MKHRLMFSAVTATSLALLGCSSAQQGGDPSRPPADFAVGLTVDSHAPGGEAWYVLDADGVLRIATGARSESSPVPPIVRQLTSAQRQQLWAQVSASGMQSAVLDAPQVNEASVREGATVFLAADGVRRAAAFDAADARVASLIASLRTLAWLPPSSSTSAR